MAVVANGWRWPLLLISVLADSSSFNSFLERHAGSYGYGMENFEAFVESNMSAKMAPKMIFIHQGGGLGNPIGAVIWVFP